MDLRKRFGESAVENNRKNRIVVVELESRTVGLIVNSASEVLKISSSEIAPPSSVFIDGEVDYVTGVAKLGERLIILLDLNKVLKTRDSRHADETVSPVASL